MGKVFAITCLLVFCIVSTAPAAEDNWRIYLKTDNGGGGGAGPYMHIGVAPTSSDSVDSQDSEASYGADLSLSTRWSVGVIPSSTYIRHIMSPAAPITYPGGTKIWELRVAALPSATNDPIRLQLATTSNSANNPPATVGGNPVHYIVKMLDNKGVAGAPANGTVWSVPIPTGTGVFWTLNNLPLLKLSAPTHSAMLNEGYRMAFIQMVPEPSSMLALGMGITGLLGFIAKKRRA